MKKWLVIAVLGISQFVMILDSTVMNVSISTVAKDLGTTISGMQAAITLYALTMAAFMLTGGKLGDKWGRHRTFRIGSIIYGIGSLITALAPSLGILLFGWSLVEGLGAVLVIPAIAALAAINYKGKDRVVAFSILGAATGLAAAVGPIIGGFVTTYLSWRYVFAAETIIMAGVLLVSGRIHDVAADKSTVVDVPSALLSAAGMSLLVFGALQSKTWGWVRPLSAPTINGHQITPLGISLVAYFILAGVIVLWLFMQRQKKLEAEKRDPLLKFSMLSIPALRSGLSVSHPLAEKYHSNRSTSLSAWHINSAWLDTA
jgi:MFS family permease